LRGACKRKAQQAGSGKEKVFKELHR
jgi:hypothetical protein